MTLKFIPPKNETLPRYASYGEGVLKAHTTIGGAKQSLAHRCVRVDHDSDLPYYQRPRIWRQGFILESVNGEWFVLHHVPEGTKSDDLPWKKDRWIHKQYSWTLDTPPKYKPEDYSHDRVTTVMTRDQYADWRVKVELERRGIDDDE